MTIELCTFSISEIQSKSELSWQKERKTRKKAKKQEFED